METNSNSELHTGDAFASRNEKTTEPQTSAARDAGVPENDESIQAADNKQDEKEFSDLDSDKGTELIREAVSISDETNETSASQGSDVNQSAEVVDVNPTQNQPEPESENPEVQAEQETAEAGVALIDEAVEELEQKNTVDSPIKSEESESAVEQDNEAPQSNTGAEIKKGEATADQEVASNDELAATTTKGSTEMQVVPGLLAQKATVAIDEDEDEDDSEEEEEEETDFANMDRLQLVEKLEELVKESDITKIKADVGQVKAAFLKLNKEFKHEAYQKLAEQNEEIDAENIDSSDAQHLIADDEIEVRYKEAFNIYKKNRAAYNEQLEKDKISNFEEKNKILEELKSLIASEETLKKTYDEFKNLQEKWKTIGMVPKGEVNTLWQNYHFLVEKFFDKVKINKELKDLDLKKNLEAKVLLCEKAEELVLEKSITRSFKQLQQYHEDWKEIGPVPLDKKDEIWERFRAATDKINERRHEYYAQLQSTFEQNLAAKEILCEKAEQLLQIENDSIKSWQDTTNKITELLKLWKALGAAPKKQNNDIWNRFKTSLDTFFNAKKEYYANLKEQQLHNYNVKLDLCVQAEALSTNTNWKSTTRELINLQNEWKKVGPVPRKQSDRIWKRFRAACDEFFKAKNEYFSNIHSHEEQNLKLKLDLIEQVKAFEVGNDRNEAVENLKSFQRQWMDIGFVPIKEKDKLQAEFRSMVNKHFEKLKMDSMASGASNYRSRIERLTKDSPDAGRVISKERGSLQSKIQRLQEDIKLWENNIGYFAESKTAMLYKQEFEKKIDQAKEELKMLEVKMKALREAGN